MFDEVKQPAWKKMLVETQERVGELKTENAPMELTPEGAFREHLEEFLTNRRKAQRKEDLLDKMPWLDEERGRYEFTMKMLHDHVTRNGMRDMSRHGCEVWIKRMGGDRVSKTPTTIVPGKGLRLWYLPAKGIEATPPRPLPPPLKQPM